jgi:hypothetical protein
VCQFLAMCLHMRLVDELPATKRSCSRAARHLATRSGVLVGELGQFSRKAAGTVIYGETGGGPALPAWFIEEALWQIEGLSGQQSE